MSMLRNLEAKLGGLVEGAFGRAFRTSVQPVELAHKLAKEMEDNQMASVSRVYVPNHYRVFLSPQDREQFASYEPALRKELSDYLLEHARQESFALVDAPAGRVPHRRAARPRASSASRPSCWRRPRRSSEEEGAARARAVRRRLRPHDGLLAEPRRAPRRARAGPPPGAARGRRPPQRAERQPRGDRPQPRGRHRAPGPERVAPPRRAAPRGRRLADRGPRLDERHQGERAARGQPAAERRATRSPSA